MSFHVVIAMIALSGPATAMELIAGFGFTVTAVVPFFVASKVEVAVIVAVPTATAVTLPVPETDAIVGAEEIRQLEPALASRFVRGVFLPDAGHCVNPEQLVLRLAENFRRNGGVIAAVAVCTSAWPSVSARSADSWAPWSPPASRPGWARAG